MNSPEMTDATAARETTRELDDARAKYRGKIIRKPALRVMDAETARLAASRIARSWHISSRSQRNNSHGPRGCGLHPPA